jgi:hypothetical protein
MAVSRTTVLRELRRNTIIAAAMLATVYALAAVFVWAMP